MTEPNVAANPIAPLDSMMAFRGKLAHPAVNSVAVQWIRLRSVSMPVVLEIDPTTACNYACQGCISAGLLNRGEMPAVELETLIRDAARQGVAGVIFIGGGEPLAHSAMPIPIELAASLGISVGLTTSGYFIERFLPTIADCVAWTRVSVDAARIETYRAVRPNRNMNAFSKVLRGLEQLNAQKKGRVGFSYLLTTLPDGRSNYGEILEAAKLAKTIGCDYFEVKPSVTPEHQLIPIHPHSREMVRNQIAEAEALADKDYSVVRAESLADALDGRVLQPKSYHECPTVHLRTVVTPGSLYICPYKRGIADRGWVRSSDIQATWRAGAAVRSRVDPSLECTFHCIRDDLNRELLSANQLPTVNPELDDPFV